MVENLVIYSKEQPGNYEINENLTYIEKDEIMKIIDQYKLGV